MSPAGAWGTGVGYVETMSRKRDDRLGRLLVQRGLLSPDQVQRARLHPRAHDEGLCGGLVALGMMTEPAILTFLAEQFHTHQVELDGTTLDPSLAQMLSFDLCQRYDAVPLEVVSRALVLAMSDPGDLHALDDIRFRAGMNVRPVVAGRASVRRALRRLFPEDMAALDASSDPVAKEARSGNLAPTRDQGPAAEEGLRQRYARALAAAREGTQGIDHPGLELSPEDQIVIRLCHELLYTAVAEELIHVRLDLLDGATRVAFWRGGGWSDLTDLPQALRVRILWHIKGLCDLPLGDLRRPVQATTSLLVGAGHMRPIRVFVVPMHHGQVILLSPVPPSLDFRVPEIYAQQGPDARRWWEAFQKGKHAQSEGRYSQAEAALRDAVAAAEDRGASGRLALGEALIHLGQVLDAAGRPADARPVFERALDVQRAELGPDSPLLVGALTGLGDAHLRLGRPDDAVALYRQALLKTELAFGPEDLEVVWLMDRIRWICEDQGNLDEAEACRDEVHRVLLELTGVDRQDVRLE